MRAAIFNGGGKPLTIESIDDPTPGAGEVVIKVRRCGVCGTDVAITAGGWGMAAGTVLGHEYCGEVVEVGAGVEGLRKGDLITTNPSMGCGDCEACRHGNFVLCKTPRSVMGGFAEYALVPVKVATKLPGAYSAADGALIEPFSIGLYGARRAQIQPGDRVLVLGGGMVALTSTFWAKRLGAGRVVAVSRSEKRTPLLKAVGADAVIAFGENEVEEALEALGGPADIVVECIGAPGMTARAVNHVKPLGKVLSLGLCTTPDALVPAVAAMKGVQIIYSVGNTLKDFQHAADVLGTDAFDTSTLITSVMPLDDIELALERLRHPNDETKIQINVG